MKLLLNPNHDQLNNHLRRQPCKLPAATTLTPTSQKFPGRHCLRLQAVQTRAPTKKRGIPLVESTLAPTTTAAPLGETPPELHRRRENRESARRDTEASDSKTKDKNLMLNRCGDRWGGGTNPHGSVGAERSRTSSEGRGRLHCSPGYGLSMSLCCKHCATLRTTTATQTVKLYALDLQQRPRRPRLHPPLQEYISDHRNHNQDQQTPAPKQTQQRRPTTRSARPKIRTYFHLIFDLETRQPHRQLLTDQQLAALTATMMVTGGHPASRQRSDSACRMTTAKARQNPRGTGPPCAS